MNKNTPIYINGCGAVSPVGGSFRSLPENGDGPYADARLSILAPDYRHYIDVRQLRRMSKIVKMALVSATEALQHAGTSQVDAIVTGTGMGCQTDTEKFLNAMLQNGESLLTPTSFIQSTHNTMAAQIALTLGNKQYNMAYVHRTFSFESALLDSMMLLADGDARQVLAGGMDEITDESWLIKTRIGHYKPDPVGGGSLYDDPQPGALSGEGSAFFVLAAHPADTTMALLRDVDFSFDAGRQMLPEEFLIPFLQRNGLTPGDIDLIITGHNGDAGADTLYDTLDAGPLRQLPRAKYKHLSGEYDTSSAFALWLAAHILQQQHLPAALSVQGTMPKTFHHVLYYNHFRRQNHSAILISRNP